mgnify:FL=1
MNVSTSTTSTTSTSDVSSVQSQTKSESNSKTSDKSFDEEMKTQSQQETKEAEKNSDKTETAKADQKTDNKQDKTDLASDNQDVTDELITNEMLSGAINFTDFKYNNEGQNLLSMNIQNLLNTKDLMSTVNSATTIDYDVINMSDDDANFFANLVQNTDMSMKDIATQVAESNNVQTAKSVQVSSVLMEKLADSLRTNQPFRIDFDKDVSVIIKVNKDGSLSANFIPGDKAVEQYLRNNISYLRQRFDEENLSYSELNYSNSREQNRQKQKKENDNE